MTQSASHRDLLGPRPSQHHHAQITQHEYQPNTDVAEAFNH